MTPAEFQCDECGATYGSQRAAEECAREDVTRFPHD